MDAKGKTLLFWYLWWYLKSSYLRREFGNREDRDIASLVKGMEDEPYIGVTEAAIVHKVGLDKSGKVGIDDPFVAALEGVLIRTGWLMLQIF